MKIKVKYPCGYEVEIVHHWYDKVAFEFNFVKCPIHGTDCE